MDAPVAIRWNCDKIKVLAVFIGHGDLEEANWRPRIDAVKNCLSSWRSRSLSYKGKALVINGLVLSRVGSQGVEHLVFSSFLVVVRWIWWLVPLFVNPLILGVFRPFALIIKLLPSCFNGWEGSWPLPMHGYLLWRSGTSIHLAPLLWKFFPLLLIFSPPFRPLLLFFAEGLAYCWWFLFGLS